jgi:polyhydroxyalkanoate synthesis repressor PhaR
LACDEEERRRVSDTQAREGAGAPDPAGRIIIKKYANRRLYNTGSSSYVTLEHLAGMVKEGVDFVVYDARTHEDITRQVLTQIIFEAENSGQNLLPIQFLRQLIRLYGDQIQAALAPSYLEMSLDAFARQGERLREQVEATLGSGEFSKPAFPAAEGYRLFEEQVRQNMALFDRTMKMFTPFAFARDDEPRPAAPAAAEADAPRDESLADLKSRLDEMQRQIERLADKG